MSNTTQTTNLEMTTVQRSGEMSAHAVAAKAKAQIEARYVIAYNRPRSILQARSDILAACQRPGFAETARYKRPVGKKQVDGRWVDQFADGFSIRFAEVAIQAMKNISVESTTIYEDDDKRTVQVSVTDLESNLTFGKEITVAKTVERKTPKEGQEVISRRTNSLGATVCLVRATEDEIANKIASAESKIIRNCGLRLVPSDILEEAESAIEKTLTNGGGDVQSSIKKITDAFATLNIGPTELEKYLRHPLNTLSPKELTDLRAIYAAIKDGEASWADYLSEPTTPKTKPKMDGGEMEAPKPVGAVKTAVEMPPNPPPTEQVTTTTEKKTAKKPKQEEPAATPPPTPEPPTQPSDTTTPEPPPQRDPVTALDEKLIELGVSSDDFRKWVSIGRWKDVFAADQIQAAAKLLGDEKSLRQLKTIYGKSDDE